MLETVKSCQKLLLSNFQVFKYKCTVKLKQANNSSFHTCIW